MAVTQVAIHIFIDAPRNCLLLFILSKRENEKGKDDFPWPSYPYDGLRCRP